MIVFPASIRSIAAGMETKIMEIPVGIAALSKLVVSAKHCCLATR